MKKTFLVVLLLILLLVLLLSSCNTATSDGEPNAKDPDAIETTTDNSGSHTTKPHEHVFDQKNIAEIYGETKATCTTAASYYYSCVCGEKGSETFTDGDAAAHVFDRKSAEATYLKAKATCTTAASYYYSCVCGEKGSKTFTSGTTVPHTYRATVVNATCNSGGYTLQSCSCGRSYKEKETPKTYAHKFTRGRVDNGSISYDAYICSDCRCEAIACGNADGSISGGNNKVKYYVTGDAVNRTNYTIYVYGTGNMPDFSQNDLPIWDEYLPQTKNIVIAEGITSIGAYAFYNKNCINRVDISLPESVSVVKSFGLYLKWKQLDFGSALTRLEKFAIDYAKMSATAGIYLPKSVVYVGEVPSGVNVFYEGTLEQLYAIKTNMITSTVTLRNYVSSFDSPASYFYFYVNAKNIGDTSQYWHK